MRRRPGRARQPAGQRGKRVIGYNRATVALVAFALVFGGALLGMCFRNVLSEHHLREDVRDVIKLRRSYWNDGSSCARLAYRIGQELLRWCKSTEIKQITANIILDLELENMARTRKTYALCCVRRFHR